MRSIIAKIREQDCIGCTKCIDACPVDAIVGAGKFTHTVIESECIGCELCVRPCPVDCIDMIEYTAFDGLAGNNLEHFKRARANLSKERFRARNKRLAEEEIEKQKRYAIMKEILLNSGKGDRR